MIEETNDYAVEYESRVHSMFNQDCPECHGHGYDDDNNPCYWCLGDGVVDADGNPLP